MAHINFENYNFGIEKFEADMENQEKFPVNKWYITYVRPTFDEETGELGHEKFTEPIMLNVNQQRCIRNENKIPVSWIMELGTRFQEGLDAEEEWTAEDDDFWRYHPQDETYIIARGKINIQTSEFAVWRIAGKPNLTEDEKKERLRERAQERLQIAKEQRAAAREEKAKERAMRVAEKMEAKKKAPIPMNKWKARQLYEETKPDAETHTPPAPVVKKPTRKEAEMDAYIKSQAAELLERLEAEEAEKRAKAQEEAPAPAPKKKVKIVKVKKADGTIVKRVRKD